MAAMKASLEAKEAERAAAEVARQKAVDSQNRCIKDAAKRESELEAKTLTPNP